MKRNLMFIGMAAVALVACAQQAGDGMSIKGTAPEGVSQLVIADMTTGKTVDSVQVSGGAFEYKGVAKPGGVYFVMPKGANEGTIVFGEDASLTLYLDKDSVSGGKVNDQFYKAYSPVKQHEKAAETLTAQAAATDAATAKQLKAQARSHRKQALEAVYAAIEDINDQVIAPIFVAEYYSKMAPQKLVEYADKNMAFFSAPMLQGFKQYAESQRESIAWIGRKFTDVTSKDADGKEHMLSEYVGKGKNGKRNIVLVDFWASWCGPCMQEMPNVKACWEQYRGQGFNVVGLSLDRSAEPWQAAIKNGGYDWVQLSNLAFWNDPAGRAYNVRSIPWNFVVDEDGIIIAVGVRGEALGQLLEEVYE